MFGLVSIPNCVNENQPNNVKIKNNIKVGTGRRIDQAEMLKDINRKAEGAGEPKVGTGKN